ncbi:hypothetical protein MMC13_003594 [Lambiella insularis]|nr:hypothetical protein [Lambiella insularis]
MVDIGRVPILGQENDGIALRKLKRPLTELPLLARGMKSLLELEANLGPSWHIDLSKSNPGIRKSSSPLSADVLSLPKNRSTGNLLANMTKPPDSNRIRFSLDAGRPADHDPTARSPVMGEHEHGLGVSGLRRIRQPPPSRAPTMPSSPELSFTSASRSSSMTLNLPHARTFTPGGPSSPTLNFSEDLSRFPSESLHSFSFAHQSEDVLHNRQNVLKKSIDFLRDRLGWAASNAGLLSAQAKVSGDIEAQSMMELLARANVLGDGMSTGSNLYGPVTGPADVDGENVFEKTFLPRSESPDQVKDEMSPTSYVVEDSSTQMSGSVEARSETSSNDQAPAAHRALYPPLSDSANSKAYQSSVTRPGLRRTYTDISPLSLQTKLIEALAKPYFAREGDNQNQLLAPTIIPSFGKSMNANTETSSSLHSHSHRSAPAAQAIFTTESESPYTILAANDLACLVFGVTMAEVRKLGILEVVREDRREWLEEKLRSPGAKAAAKARSPTAKSRQVSPSPMSSLGKRGGITALLLSKPSSRQTSARRAQTDDGSGSSYATKKSTSRGLNYSQSDSRGVLLCGDVVPILKRNGAIGSASLWVKEKRKALIWVLEEIVEDMAFLTLDETGKVLDATGATEAICGENRKPGRIDIRRIFPGLPIHGGQVDYDQINALEHFTARHADGFCVPTSITTKPALGELRVSSFPHIAGIMVLSATDLTITSSNSAFSAALFGQSQPNGLKITRLIPQFDNILNLLEEEEQVRLVDGIVVPEHSFRRARALLALREGNADAAAIFFRPTGLVAKHRDGSNLHIDVSMRVVKSESHISEETVMEEPSESGSDRSDVDFTTSSQVVYALWITYSRHLHSIVHPGVLISPLVSRPGTPPCQPSPGQSVSIITSQMAAEDLRPMSPATILTKQIEEATSEPISKIPSAQPVTNITISSPSVMSALEKKSISDFIILEEMGQGAYGQVKLARYKNLPSSKCVLKYVTKKRILLDTWIRDRRLGTIPLEIHVLDYLRREDYRHPNIVEMRDFFEDNNNYYIEMVPHGLPGMDLFDYIEMRSTMEEAECRDIFLQVVAAVHHLHTKALVVHRDIKDENIILDGEHKVKLIDFGSAAYIKSGPFDVFVGTIGLFSPLFITTLCIADVRDFVDYAAPEVLQGKPYRGKEQDVWALGILLYTLVYKENPFYSVDEILDHELRIPWIMSEGSIDLIKAMLTRDTDKRLTISQVKSFVYPLQKYDSR